MWHENPTFYQAQHLEQGVGVTLTREQADGYVQARESNGTLSDQEIFDGVLTEDQQPEFRARYGNIFPSSEDLR